MTAPGRLVAGRYRLQSQIGGGGMGTVWLARDELLGREVAIKQILSAPGANSDQIDEQRQRALREGRIAARLSHPHAISVYDVALENEQPWLVMEYLPSRSLAAVLAEDGVLRSDVVAQIGAQVADALAATHAAGIVHRDVKPANILIGQGGRVEGLVKITDFCISHASGDVTLTQTGQITGTPAFLAPEVAQGYEMTEASDVFSLGATLYTCLEGQPPFGMEENALAMLHRVASGNIRPPLRAGMMVDPLLKVLAAEPGDRPTMVEFRDELAKLAAGRDGDTTTVLLARTDLRSAVPGRNRTATFPAAAPAPEPTPDPTPPPPPPVPAAASPPRPEPAPEAKKPAPVAAPPRQPGAAPPRQPGARRARALWIAAAAGALVLAGLVVFWAVSLNGPDDPVAQNDPTTTSSSSSQTTSEQETTSESESTEATDDSSSSTESSSTSSATRNPLTADNIEAFLLDYHQQVLSDPRAAYARTGPTLRGQISEDDYVAYWQQFSDVNLSDIQATDGNNVARATMELVYTDGSNEVAGHTFTFIVEGDQLILDSDFQD
jgi:serine/threonine protein kinase